MPLPFVHAMRRASRSLAGPIAFAGSNFLVAILLQRSVGASQFGQYAFCQIIVAAGLGVSNGLLGNPLTVLLAGSSDDHEAILGSFFRANLLYCAFGFVLTLVLMHAAGAFGWSLVLMGVLAFASWLRWFIRSSELAARRQSSASLIDIVFGAFSVIGALFLLLYGKVTLESIMALLVFVSLTSTMLAAPRLVAACVAARRGSLQIFKSALVNLGGWATFTNVATQISVNSHAYLITLTVGTTAFAPVALATILFRPLGVILTGLVQYEQPIMANHIGRNELSRLKSDVAFVRNLVTLAWVGNSLVVVLLLVKFPSQVSRDNAYDLRTLVSATLLVGVITLLRSMREPMSSALQAAGCFRELAKIAAFCSPVPLVVSWVLLLARPSDVALSLFGALLGEAANLVLVYGCYARFRMAWEESVA